MHASPRFLPSLLAALSLALLAVPVCAVAADEPVGVPVGTLMVPSGLSLDDVRDVVAYSLAARGWTVKDKKENRVIGHLQHRGYDATITFVVHAEEIAIYCDSYTVDKHGERKKPKLPQGWINNLKKDIPKRLAMKSASV